MMLAQNVRGKAATLSRIHAATIPLIALLAGAATPLAAESSRGVIKKFLGAAAPAVSIDQFADIEIPGVGCEQDGQTGPISAPTVPATKVFIPRELAPQLSYYTANPDNRDAGVVGPRGWSCFGTYGSSGTSLYVVPTAITGDIIDRPGKIGGGAAIVLNTFYGDTSGRFPMAKAAARIFPQARAFVAKVKAEKFGNAADYLLQPWPREQLVRLSSDVVSFTTPASVAGTGTIFGPAAGAEPVRGLAFIELEDEPTLTRLAIRLPRELGSLFPAIAAAKLAEGP